ncbi:MAG TPA: hypothetical protein PL009_13735 [Flavipsychrobacter sp.]|nr:hypothetical protein [Flavipsychrobacter sp.]
MAKTTSDSVTDKADNHRIPVINAAISTTIFTAKRLHETILLVESHERLLDMIERF